MPEGTAALGDALHGMCKGETRLLVLPHAIATQLPGWKQAVTTMKIDEWLSGESSANYEDEDTTTSSANSSRASSTLPTGA